MKWQKKEYLCAIFALCLYGLSIVDPVEAETVKIGGSGFGLGVMKILVESFEKSHPGEKIEVVPSLGSSGGIKALLHGALDIAVSGRPLNESESGQGIEANELARSPFIFIVNPSVTKKEINLQELEEIFSGAVLTWPDGIRIRPILRPNTDAVTRVLRGLSSGMDHAVTMAMAQEGMILAITDQESADYVEKTSGALGACTLTQVYSEKRQVSILSFNGIVPSVKDISESTDPLSISLYLVTAARTVKTSQSFLEFLYSDDGRNILKANGNLVVGTSTKNKQ